MLRPDEAACAQRNVRLLCSFNPCKVSSTSPVLFFNWQTLQKCLDGEAMPQKQKKMQASIDRHALLIAQQETAAALAGRIVYNGYTPMDIDTSRLNQEHCDEWDNYLHTYDSEAPSAGAMGNVEVSFCNDEGEQQQTSLAEAISSYGFTVRAGGDRFYRWPFNADLLTSQEAQEKAAMLLGRLQGPAHIEIVEISAVEDDGMESDGDGQLHRVRNYGPDANGDVNNCWVVCTLNVYDNEDKQGNPKLWHGNVDILIQDFDLTVSAD